MTPSFGSLDRQLAAYPEGARLFLSAGPVSDSFITTPAAVALLNGPVGSGKTTACVKRALFLAQSQPPLSGGERYYKLAAWRATYDQLWKTTIPSWKKVLNWEAGIGRMVGAPPRSAVHVIDFEDRHGRVRLEVLFQAFSEESDPEDLGGLEIGDAYLNEWNTLPEALFVNLVGRVGRAPTRGELGLPDDERVVYGRIWGDCNAPTPTDAVYRDFWTDKKPPGYQLFRQPGGLDPNAENISAVGRQYYRQQIAANTHRPWWIRTKVHNEPGYNRDTDVVFPKFTDSQMVAAAELAVYPEIPVLVGVDAGFTPAAAFVQELLDGQFRVLAEVALARGDEGDLAVAMKAVMARPRFVGCEFAVVTDPAGGAGEVGTSGSSFRSRLERALGLRVALAPSNKLPERIAALAAPMERLLSDARPGFLLDPSCTVIRQGLNGTYAYRRVHGSNERSGVVKTPDSHAVEAAQYAALLSGSAQARTRETARRRERERRQEQGRGADRYNPLGRMG